MELKLIEEIKKEKYTARIYQIDKYEVEVRDFGILNYYKVKTPKDELYAPSIVHFSSEESGIEEFKIQTASFGEMSVDELEKYLDAYKKAAVITRILNKELLG